MSRAAYASRNDTRAGRAAAAARGPVWARRLHNTGGTAGRPASSAAQTPCTPRCGWVWVWVWVWVLLCGGKLQPSKATHTHTHKCAVVWKVQTCVLVHATFNGLWLMHCVPSFDLMKLLGGKAAIGQLLYPGTAEMFDGAGSGDAVI